MNNKKTYTAKEAAQILGITVHTFYWRRKRLKIMPDVSGKFFEKQIEEIKNYPDNRGRSYKP